MPTSRGFISLGLIIALVVIVAIAGLWWKTSLVSTQGSETDHSASTLSGTTFTLAVGQSEDYATGGVGVRLDAISADKNSVSATVTSASTTVEAFLKEAAQVWGQEPYVYTATPGKYLGVSYLDTGAKWQSEVPDLNSPMDVLRIMLVSIDVSAQTATFRIDTAAASTEG